MNIITNIVVQPRKKSGCLGAAQEGIKVHVNFEFTRHEPFLTCKGPGNLIDTGPTVIVFWFDAEPGLM